MTTTFGSDSNDRLIGTPEPDQIYGGTGDDYIDGGVGGGHYVGGDGNDALVGMNYLLNGDSEPSIQGNIFPRRDVLSGHEGADTFKLRFSDLSVSSHSIIVTDYNPGEGDRIEISAPSHITDNLYTVQDTTTRNLGPSSFSLNTIATDIIDSDTDQTMATIIDSPFSDGDGFSL